VLRVLDDGATMTATLGKATRLSTVRKDSIDMLATTDTAGITIYAATPTPLTAQTFLCGQTASGQSLLLSYRNDDPAGPTIRSDSCTAAYTGPSPDSSNWGCCENP
jgi:hypothetical protein